MEKLEILREKCEDMYWSVRLEFIDAGTCDDVRLTLDDMRGARLCATRGQRVFAAASSAAGIAAVFVCSIPGIF